MRKRRPFYGVNVSLEARQTPGLDDHLSRVSRPKAVNEERKEERQSFRAPGRLWRGRGARRGNGDAFFLDEAPKGIRLIFTLRAEKKNVYLHGSFHI